jgi:hypothetical protein
MARFAFASAVSAVPVGSAGRQAQQSTITPDGGGYLWFGAPGANAVRWDFDALRWDGVACERLHEWPSSGGSGTCVGPR